MKIKLGKVLDLSLFYIAEKTDKLGRHWTHPDLKEDKMYIVERNDSPLLIGKFDLLKPPYSTFWQFEPNYGCTNEQLSYGDNPNKDWLHIQEIEVET